MRQEGRERRDRRFDHAVGIGRIVGLGRRAIVLEAFVVDEQRRGVDEFIEVLDPVLAFLFAFVKAAQIGAMHDMLDDLGQRELLGLEAHAFDELDEVGEAGAGLAAQVRHRRVQRGGIHARRVGQLFERARTDAARRKIDHAREGGVVVRVLHQAQIRERVLDFGALEKAQAAIDAIGNAGLEQIGFDDPRLRIAAIKHRNFAARFAGADQALDFFDDPLRFLAVGHGFIHTHRLAMAAVGAQILAQALGVARDQLVGGIENVAVAAVILFELDQMLDLKLALEGGHVAHIGAAKRVDALVVVADREHRRLFAEQLEPAVLQGVGVLEFIDQDVLEARLVMRAQRLVGHQHFIRAQQQLGEIDHAFLLALAVVLGIKLDQTTVVIVVDRHILGAQAFFLAIVDEVLDVLGRVFRVVDIQRFEQALDGRQLIGAVEDLEGLRQARIAPMRAQKAIAQPVESADPHAAHIDRQHRRQARQHFLGGLVGEGHGQDAGRAHPPLLDQPGDACGQHPGLARARAGQDERRFVGQRDRGALFFVERIEQAVGKHGRGRNYWIKNQPAL